MFYPQLLHRVLTHQCPPHQQLLLSPLTNFWTDFRASLASSFFLRCLLSCVFLCFPWSCPASLTLGIFQCSFHKCSDKAANKKSSPWGHSIIGNLNAKRMEEAKTPSTSQLQAFVLWEAPTTCQLEKSGRSLPMCRQMHSYNGNASVTRIHFAFLQE